MKLLAAAAIAALLTVAALASRCEYGGMTLPGYVRVSVDCGAGERGLYVVMR